MPAETRQQQIDRESRYLRTFQTKADSIAHLIVNTDLPWVDVVIQIERLREEALRLFPQKMFLFDLVYLSRFRRLWHQWRGDHPAV
jgi:hypothetical protein